MLLISVFLDVVVIVAVVCLLKSIILSPFNPSHHEKGSIQFVCSLLLWSDFVLYAVVLYM